MGAPPKLYLAGSRSREGAWIEIDKYQFAVLQAYSRSREGAWIEIGAAAI